MYRRSQEGVCAVGLARSLLKQDEVLQVLLDALLLLLERLKKSVALSYVGLPDFGKRAGNSKFKPAGLPAGRWSSGAMEAVAQTGWGPDSAAGSAVETVLRKYD